MKKRLIYTSFILLLLFAFTACVPSEEGSTQATTSASQIVLSDYILPDNFAMTIRISDASIFNPGLPWYYKTAKIGNDWQLIHYDRDLPDLTLQDTFYFEYVSLNRYKEYQWDNSQSEWVYQEEVSFDVMVNRNLNNFWFLTKNAMDGIINYSTDSVAYDIDPTSNVTTIPAIQYSYTLVHDVEVTVSEDYPNIILKESIYVDKTLVTEVYELSTSVSSWDSSYLSYRGYQNK